MLLAQDTAGILDVVDCDPSDGGKEIYTLISQSNPDVFLIDMRHPPLNELELARTVTRYSPSIRVVIISSNPYDSDDELLEVIKSGAAGYIRSKECSPSTVVDTITRVAKGEYPINDTVSNKPMVASLVLKQFQEISSSIRREDDIVTPLTQRERQVLNLIADGNPNKQIGRLLNISEQTIKNHVSTILRKLNANDRAHAVVLALRNGLIPLDKEQKWGRRSSDILAKTRNESMINSR